MTTTEPLTEREQQALEQMRKAQELGSTLKGYAAKIGLDVRQLYELRRRLVRKGAFEAPARRKATEARKAGAFIPVHVVPAAPVPSSTSPTCRLVFS
jgi:hypothetical protein